MKFDLKKSKSMWGFGLAILFYFGRKLLISQGVVLPEGEWDWIIMFVNGFLVVYGVYGFRDAIRKVQTDQYYNDPLKKNIPKNDADNLGQLEQEYQDKQYKENEPKSYAEFLERVKSGKLQISIVDQNNEFLRIATYIEVITPDTHNLKPQYCGNDYGIPHHFIQENINTEAEKTFTKEEIERRTFMQHKDQYNDNIKD